MSHHWSDNLHTTLFSPRDYQVELLAAAFERNTIICLGRKSSKEFIALKLLQELGRKARYTHSIVGVYLSCNKAPTLYTMLQNLTDFQIYQETNDFTILPKNYNIYILQPRTLLISLRNCDLKLSDICVLILEDCHCDVLLNDALSIFREFYLTNESLAMPKVLGLAGPLHSAGCALGELDAMLKALEKTIHCKTETASDIVTVLRYCAKPYEFIMQCASYQPDELSTLIQDIILTRRTFLDDHRYDPSEIYNTDEFLEELKDIPDPKAEPLKFLNIISNVLEEMGPWCADRVALHLYQRIEKQKIKTPHERHYILLCFINTTLLLIHTICEQHFRNYKRTSSDHMEMIANYSSLKVLRLLEVLRLFKPTEAISQHDNLKAMTSDLEQIDFQKLSRLLENKCHIVEQSIQMQQMQSRSIIENLDSIAKPQNININKVDDSLRIPNSNSHCNNNSRKFNYDTAKQKTATTNTNRRNNPHNQYSRTKRRIYHRRQRDFGDNSENLWALVFCNCNFTARVLFDLLAEMSRCDPSLKFLKCQYTTDRIADPLTEPKEAEIEHRRQEEVLKRFRSHECNVLIATSVLEEGIDIPKCNLVIRWDPPTTYRSYVQCKGRARSIPAYHVILVAGSSEPTEISINNNKREQLSMKSHYMLCKSVGNMENTLDDTTDTTDNEDEQPQVNGLSQKYSLTYNSVKGKVKILNPEVITTKPPIKSATNEFILKEINEEPAAIKDVQDRGPEMHTEIDESKDPEEPTQNSLIITQLENDDHNTYNKSLLYENKEYKLYDLDKTLECLEKIKESEANANSTESTESTESNDSTTKIKTFTCCFESENFPKSNDSINGFLSPEMHGINSMEIRTKDIVKQMAQYMEIEKILLAHCANMEPFNEDHYYSGDIYNTCVKAYKPLAHLLTGSSVDLSNSIVLVNKYCARLPSDSFTRLTPLWRCSYTIRNNIKMYQYTLRLPINSPLKYDIIGLPMPTQILARRIAALQTCIALHRCGELDDNLQPIGKENFKAVDLDWENFELEEEDEKIVKENIEPRPGTTKRRQYYFKRIANEFCNCRPIAGQPCYLYLLDLRLQCPIPEEQNTRGRKIYPPEEAHQSFGILTLKKIPKVSSFPIFTRSGEVKVSLILHHERIILNDEQINKINVFINYTFTKVLRLKKFLMLFDPESTENCIFIVPIVRNDQDDASKHIDWHFLDVINKNADVMPTPVPEEIRHNVEFDAEKFKDAVVMPWYRNQDQPHYFYVAEICQQLSPQSSFPSKKYQTFMHYYYLKYGLKIHGNQPLLDVDHTSARLNFLTPRYVNRKGVALPTSSEATKRAKRENLELKQILVPELCTIHPFPASLWRTAVCLPCILYRINALLLADDIRKKVVHDLGLGHTELPNDQEWPMLDFGWSLSDVLNKSKSNKAIKVEECLMEENLDLDIENLKKIDLEKDVESRAKKYETFHTKSILSPKKTFEKRTLNEIVEDAEHKLSQDINGSFIEIGTWSNDMATKLESVDEGEDDDDDRIANECEKDLLNGVLPSAIKFCSKSVRSASPTFIDIDLKKKENDWEASFSDDSDDDGDDDDDDDSFIESSFASYDEEEDSDEDDIEFTSKNEAENIETEQDVEKFKRQLSIIHASKENERVYQNTKNLLIGYDFDKIKNDISSKLQISIEGFEKSVKEFILKIETSGMLIASNETIKLPLKDAKDNHRYPSKNVGENTLISSIPYIKDKVVVIQDNDKEVVEEKEEEVSIELLEKLNMQWMDKNPDEIYSIKGCGDIFDNFSDHHKIVINVNGGKQIRLQFDKQGYEYQQSNISSKTESSNCYSQGYLTNMVETFSFDAQPDLTKHPGPSPSIILQALTMSNANDGINLERLETIGDSFLKYAITTYLYITYENVHEGKLSHLRSKQVANLNLYRLGRRKLLGEYMIATKFEPSDNWLPPCYYVPKELEKALIEAKIPPHYWKFVNLVNIKKLSNAEICELVRQKAEEWGLNLMESSDDATAESYKNLYEWDDSNSVPAEFSCFIPYNLVSQHSIPDKSVADCVEALIGAYLIECGFRGALLFMAWLGIRVLPYERIPYDPDVPRIPGSTVPDEDNMITVYGSWPEPKSPLLCYIPNAGAVLEDLLIGYDEFEKNLGYKFRDRSYLLQAMTHASYTPNRLTDCYQRLEFLGDAVLDYLITRHLYEDPRQHSPGALTDLRSALVNNTIFASLAVRHGFHKYFRHLSPGLNEVIDRFVRIQNENGHSISEEYYLLSEEECDDAEDVEVPKALGDVFESVAGAIFLDSNMCLDEVWRVYSNIMRPEIEQFSNFVPKSPIRELLELEPETAKFGKPEKLADGRRVRVTVEVFCKGTYRGIGRNYRIAKCTAAKCALRQLKKKGLIGKRIY